MKARMSAHGFVNNCIPLVILVLVVLAGMNLYHPLRNWRQLNRDLDEARRRLDELQVLYPLYAELASLDSPVKWPGLKPPVSQQLSEKEVSAIPDRFLDMAARCRLELGTVSPRVETDDAGVRRLNVELRGTGPYGQFKPFLMELAQMPVLARIQRVEIRRESAPDEQFTILAQLALE